MGRVPSLAVLAALVALSTVARSWAGLDVPTPWIAADEMTYAELGRSLWEEGRLAILGEDAAFYSLVHPALIGLPLALFGTDAGYDVARVLEALVMSLAAVPVFLWGRTLMREPWALVAAALTLAIPGLAYSGLLMTETVFYPAVTAAAWAAVRVLVRPALGAQAVLAAVVLVVVLTRLQGVVLVPAFAVAVVLFALLERDRTRLRQTWPALAALAAILLGVVAAGLGAYEPAGKTSYDVADAVRFAGYHAGDAALLVGLAPVCALALLALPSTRLVLGADERAYLAVAVALLLGFVAEVGLFASRYVGRLAERDLLPLAPVLFLGLCLWLDRGAPRTRVSASVAALAGAAIVVLLPYGRLVHKGAIQDAFMLLPLWELGSYDLVVGLAAAVVVVLFVLLPRALPLALVALFVAVSVEASRFVEREAKGLRTSFFAASPTWIDDAARGGVAYLYDGEPHWNAVWGHVFWNRRLERVYWLAGTRRVPGPLPQERVAPAPDGRLADDAPSYVVASTAFTLAGERVAAIDQTGLIHRGLVLWRAMPPLRLSTVLTGVQGSGDIYGPAQLVAYGCTGGRFELTLVAKGAPVTVDYRAGELGTLTLAPEQVVNATIRAAPADGVCTLDLEPSGLVGSTRVEFIRD